MANLFAYAKPGPVIRKEHKHTEQQRYTDPEARPAKCFPRRNNMRAAIEDPQVEGQHQNNQQNESQPNGHWKELSDYRTANLSPRGLIQPEAGAK